MPAEIRDAVTGGIQNVLPLSDALDAFGEKKDHDWTPAPNRYYFSGTMSCFRKSWFKQMNRLAKQAALPEPYPEDPDNEYETGNSEAGNAVEQHLIAIWKRLYGFEGAVLKDVRFSLSVETDFGPIMITGKSDPIIIGDNLDVLEFNEVKSALFWAKKHTSVTEKYGRVVPLSLVGVDSPDEAGPANVNNVAQLALGASILAKKGMAPKKTVLTYVSRSNFEDNLQILLSPKDIEFFARLAEWWVVEHHADLQKKETPPEPQFFMGYECKYCSFADACLKAGGTKTIHPIMRGLNERLRISEVGATSV
jgi:hypothetical protein